MEKTDVRKYIEAKREGYLAFERQVKDTVGTIIICTIVCVYAWVMCG